MEHGEEITGKRLLGRPSCRFYLNLLNPFVDVLLTVHLSIFILVLNQIDAQFFFQ